MIRGSHFCLFLKEVHVSRGNIVSIIASGADSIVVTFTLHHKRGGFRAYEFSGGPAISILNGADPADFSGVEVSPSRSSVQAFARNAAGAANAGEDAVVGAMGESELVEASTAILAAF
jgi:hypothetical protein